MTTTQRHLDSHDEIRRQFSAAHTFGDASYQWTEIPGDRDEGKDDVNITFVDMEDVEEREDGATRFLKAKYRHGGEYILIPAYTSYSVALGMLRFFARQEGF